MIFMKFITVYWKDIAQCCSLIIESSLYEPMGEMSLILISPVFVILSNLFVSWESFLV